MTKQTEAVQKKCCHCGHLYRDCEMFLGLPRCPNPRCFKLEKFVYVDGDGKVLLDYTSSWSKYSCTKNRDYRNDRDGGCVMAELWLGRKGVSCTEDCPFSPDCIEWIDLRNATHLKRIFKRRHKIQKVYKLRDDGMSINAIKAKTNVPYSTIQIWLVKRQLYEKLLKGDISTLVGARA